MQGSRLLRIAGYALSKPAAYLIVGLTFLAVVTAILGGWPGWVVLASLVAGALMLGLLVLDALSDPNADRDVSLVDVDVARVRDRALRARVEKAMEYVRAAQKLARNDRTGVLDGAGDELPQLEQAARSIFQMALRLEEFRADRLIPRDLADLQRQASRPGALSDDQKEQWQTLKRLDDLVKTAEKEIDSALADLGRSYAEMQAIRVTPGLRGQSSEALGQLAASTQRLSDLAAGYDEAYGGRTPGGAAAK